MKTRETDRKKGRQTDTKARWKRWKKSKKKRERERERVEIERERREVKI
jgi:hypothetical protein